MSSNVSDNSQGDTGTRDITYDLISTAYHLLQGAETVALYVADAEQEGNQELVQFFRETKEEYQRRADRAKELLTSHLGQSGGQAAAGGGS
ncbi:MAG TPA: hypothetical protein VN256_05875 [Pyrinomonadaceae bacterium]|nr:hypothetical protein [Pyrinomonadaceae bacterium]